MQSTSITNRQGERLAMMEFIPESEPRRLVIICHGFRGGKENGGRIYHFAQRLNQLDMAVIAFDFSGSGASEGSFANMTLSRQAADLESVVDYGCKKFAGAPVILLGRSFGGSTVLAESAGDKRIAAVALWSTPAFLGETFAAMMPAEYNRMKMGQVVTVQDEFGSFEMGPDLARDFACHDMKHYMQLLEERPVLIIQARDDELVPPENAIYMNAQMKNASLYMVEEAGHRFLEKISLREDITIAWFEKLEF